MFLRWFLLITKMASPKKAKVAFEQGLFSYVISGKMAVQPSTINSENNPQQDVSCNKSHLLQHRKWCATTASVFGKLERVKIVSKHLFKVCILNSNLNFGEQSTWYVFNVID